MARISVCSYASCMLVVSFVDLMITYAQPREQLYEWDASTLTGWSKEPVETTEITVLLESGKGYENCLSLSATPCVEIKASTSISRPVPTLNYHTIELAIDMKSTFDNNANSTGASCWIQYSVPNALNASYTIPVATGINTMVNYTVSVQDTDPFNNQGLFQVSIGNGARGGKNNKCYVDNLRISGIPYTTSPTSDPSTSPTKHPSNSPSTNPSSAPSANPSISPLTTSPTYFPSDMPSNVPSRLPTDYPSKYPSSNPSEPPSAWPTAPRSTDDNDEDDNEQGDAQKAETEETSSFLAVGIIGAIVGSFMGLVFIATAVYCAYRKKKQKKDEMVTIVMDQKKDTIGSTSGEIQHPISAPSPRQQAHGRVEMGRMMASEQNETESKEEQSDDEILKQMTEKYDTTMGAEEEQENDEEKEEILSDEAVTAGGDHQNANQAAGRDSDEEVADGIQTTQ